MQDQARAIQKDVSISSESLTSVAKYSAIAGLCPIIPVPFLDDAILKRVRRRMLRELGDKHGLVLSDSAVKTLTERESHLIRGALKTIVFYPIKKILKKVLVVFLVKACADVATSTVEEGWLFTRAIECDYIDVDKLAAEDDEELERLRDGIIVVMKEVDSSAARAAMRSVYGIFKNTFSELGAAMKRFARADGDRFDEVAAVASSLVARVEEVIRNEWTNFEALDESLRRELSGS